MKTIRHRNMFAKLLHDPRYKQRVVKSKVVYDRKKKNRGKDNDKHSNSNQRSRSTSI